MNEKNTICLIIALFFVIMCAGFCAGYWFRSRTDVRPAGPTDNEFRAESEAKQRRIDELEAQLGDFRNLVSDGFRDIGGIVERISGEIDSAARETGDIRKTVGLIREAVKELENSERYFRGLADSIPGGERHSGGE